MLLVAGLILGAVYAPNGDELLKGFYGRLLATSAIVDVTLSIVIAGMHRLYIQKHPELLAADNGKPQQSGHSWAKIIDNSILFLGGPFLLMLIMQAIFSNFH